MMVERRTPKCDRLPLWDGHAAERIVKILETVG
jgi:hypothetical protein